MYGHTQVLLRGLSLLYMRIIIAIYEDYHCYILLSHVSSYLHAILAIKIIENLHNIILFVYDVYVILLFGSPCTCH